MKNFFQKLFGSSKSTNNVDEDLIVFQNTFSFDQKVAMICTMFGIANFGGKVSEMESRYINHTARFLGVSMNDPKFISTASKYKGDKYKTDIFLIDSLISMKDKSYYITTVHGLILCSEDSEEKKEDKLAYAMRLCKRIGISEEQYVNRIEMDSQLRKAFLG